MKIPTHTINPSEGTKTRISWHGQPILAPESSRPVRVPRRPDIEAKPRPCSTAKAKGSTEPEQPADRHGFLAALIPEIAVGVGAVAAFGMAGRPAPVQRSTTLSKLVPDATPAASAQSAPAPGAVTPAGDRPDVKQMPLPEAWHPWSSHSLAANPYQSETAEALVRAFAPTLKTPPRQVVVIVVDADSIAKGLAALQPHHVQPSQADTSGLKAFIDTVWQDLVRDLTDPAKLADKVADEISTHALELIGHGLLDLLVAPYIAMRFRRNGQENNIELLVVTADHLKTINALFERQVLEALNALPAKQRDRFLSQKKIDWTELRIEPIPISAIAKACDLSVAQTEAILKAGFFAKIGDAWAIPQIVEPDSLLVILRKKLQNLKPMRK